MPFLLLVHYGWGFSYASDSSLFLHASSLNAKIHWWWEIQAFLFNKDQMKNVVSKAGGTSELMWLLELQIRVNN